MPARRPMILRSHPGRSATVAVAVLLASGAVVAALGSGSDGSGGAEKSLSSNGLHPVAGGPAVSSDASAYGGSVPTTAPEASSRATATAAVRA